MLEEEEELVADAARAGQVVTTREKHWSVNAYLPSSGPAERTPGVNVNL